MILLQIDVNIGQNTIQYAAAAPRQPQPAATRPPQPNRVVQLDGAHDTSDEDDDEDEYRDNDDDHDDNDDEVNDDDNEGQGEDEVCLNLSPVSDSSYLLFLTG